MLKIAFLILFFPSTVVLSQLKLKITDEHQIEIPYCKVTFIRDGIKQTQFTNGGGQLDLSNEVIKCNFNYFFIISQQVNKQTDILN